MQSHLWFRDLAVGADEGGIGDGLHDREGPRGLAVVGRHCAESRRKELGEVERLSVNGLIERRRGRQGFVADVLCPGIQEAAEVTHGLNA